MVVNPLVLVTRDHKLNGVLVFAQERMQAVIGELGWLVLNERIVDEDEGRLVLLKLSLEPVELLFPKRTNVRMKIRRGAVLRAAKKIIKVNEFVTLVVQG